MIHGLRQLCVTPCFLPSAKHGSFSAIVPRMDGLMVTPTGDMQKYILASARIFATFSFWLGNFACAMPLLEDCGGATINLCKRRKVAAFALVLCTIYQWCLQHSSTIVAGHWFTANRRITFCKAKCSHCVPERWLSHSLLVKCKSTLVL